MSHAHATSPSTNRAVVLAIGVLIAGYAVTCGFGWPQHGTELVKAGHHEVAETAEQHAPLAHPNYFWVSPFVILLLCIAVLPLLPQTEHFWESNLNRFYVAAGLGIFTLTYFLLWHNAAVESHWPAHSVVEPVPGATLQWGLAWTVFANAILHEYVPFIVLLFSLFTISGGIRIEGNLAAHPLTNSAFIATGGVLASFVGTTGAAMLLIRPLIDTNKERHYKVHTVIFFIFVVCNCGGCLLPIGDPPLFLGYLRGVDFLWTLALWKEWLFVNALLLAVYWAWDHFFVYPHEAKLDRAADEVHIRRLRISGWQVNVPLLIGVVLCVAMLDPSKPVPGTDWHSPLYLREVVQLGLVGLSLWLGDFAVRVKNHFTYHAIVEVAALFLGIFICMQPALQILHVKGPNMGIDSPMLFFWVTGGLSSVLDNAPTYVVFFETAKTLNEPPGYIHPHTVIEVNFLVAISVGSVFMGAMTYIGNGPNFMVKAIAETSGIKMPSFFGYLVYSVCILLPIFALTTLIFIGL